MSEEKSRRPLYQQLREAVRTRIEDGDYPLGSVLPSEQEMAQAFSTTRQTVRNAYAALEDEGLVRRVQGKGVYVAKPSPGTLDVGDGRSFRQSTRASGAEPSVRILGRETRPAGAWYAKVFSIGADDPIYVIRRVNSVDGVPLSLERTVVPLVRFPRLEGIDLSVFSLYEVFGYYGKVVDATSEHLDIAELSVHDAHVLGVETGRPAMAYDCLSYDQDGLVIEHTRTLRRGDLGFYTVRY